MTPLTNVIIKNNANLKETDPAKLLDTKTNIEIHRTWGQGLKILPFGTYIDFFTVEQEGCSMRKDCELEIIASPDSKCIGPYVGNCGVTMVNH